MTAIEWTDATWNPTTGCDRVSPGCANCYALTLAARLKAMGQKAYQNDGDPRTSGPGFALTLHPDRLEQPLRWRKPRRVFVNSMSDLFHEDVPDTFLASVLDVMARTPQHTFQVLTKRPERALEWTTRFAAAFNRPGPWPLPNVWLGVSIENARFTYRADVLRQIPAAVRFISAEPLLGSLYEHGRTRHERERDRSGAIDPSALEIGAERNLVHDGPRGAMGSPLCEEPGCKTEAVGPFDHLCYRHYRDEKPAKAPLDLSGIDWLIAGGESGRGARALNAAWVKELRDACQANGTAFFFKQWGGKTPKSGGRILDGREWSEYPA